MSMLRRWRDGRGAEGNGRIPVRTEGTGEMSDPLYDFEQRLDQIFDDFLAHMENTIGQIGQPTDSGWSGSQQPRLGSGAAQQSNTNGQTNWPTQQNVGAQATPPTQQDVGTQTNRPTQQNVGAQTNPPTQQNVGGQFQPPMDFCETDEEYQLMADLPGLSKSDCEVTVSNHSVIIRGERNAEAAQTNGDFHHRERQYGMFRRSFDLPNDVDADGVTASFKNGVLRVRLPKTEAAQSTRRHIHISS